MKIVNELPPNIKEIIKVFDLKEFNPIFTYGDTIYNPAKLPITKDLIVHEEHHEKQQQKMGAENWWELYLKDKVFRLSQEIEAYRIQYEYVAEHSNRKERKHLLQQMAKNLSSRLYGGLISKREALAIIYD